MYLILVRGHLYCLQCNTIIHATYNTNVYTTYMTHNTIGLIMLMDNFRSQTQTCINLYFINLSTNSSTLRPLQCGACCLSHPLTHPMNAFEHLPD